MKLKSGRADRVALSILSVDRPKLVLGVSIADMGRLPVAREKDDGAEEGGLAGKVNGGLGGGRSARDCSSSDSKLVTVSMEAANLSEGLSNAVPAEGCTKRSGPKAVAIFFSAAQRL